MKPSNIRLFILMSVLSFFCLTAMSQKKKHTKKHTPAKTASSGYKNGIKLTSNGFTISEAYLALDDETLVPDDNKVALNQNVNMVLIIEKGWTESGGRVYPGSKQLIKLSNGFEVLKSEDLFAAFDESGVSPEDAKYITLNAIVTEIKNKKNWVIVNFNIWDKKGAATVSGSYKLYIK